MKTIPTYRILAHDNDLCTVSLIKMDKIEVKRRASQVFHFKDVERFMEAITGAKKACIYAGKVLVNPNTSEEKWMAYHWNPSDPKQDTWGSSDSMLPLGTIAWLELTSEYELEAELETLQQMAYNHRQVWEEIQKLANQIHRIDNDNKFSNPRRFEYMSAKELQKLRDEMKNEFAELMRGAGAPIDDTGETDEPIE